MYIFHPVFNNLISLYIIRICRNIAFKNVSFILMILALIWGMIWPSLCIFVNMGEKKSTQLSFLSVLTITITQHKI